MDRLRRALIPALALLCLGAAQADARGFGRGGYHGGGFHGGGWGGHRPMIMGGVRRPAGLDRPVFDNRMPTVCMRQRWAVDAWGNPYRTYRCR